MYLHTYGTSTAVIRSPSNTSSNTPLMAMQSSRDLEGPNNGSPSSDHGRLVSSADNFQYFHLLFAHANRLSTCWWCNKPTRNLIISDREVKLAALPSGNLDHQASRIPRRRGKLTLNSSPSEKTKPETQYMSQPEHTLSCNHSF